MTEVNDSPEIPKARSVGILVVKDDKVLLVRHEEGAGHVTGVYGLPAGRPDRDDEEDVDVAVRELEQETGLMVNREDLRTFPDSYYEAVIPRKDGSIINFAWQVFKAVRFDGELRSSDETTPEWKSMEELRDLEADGRLLPNTIAAAEAGMKA